MFFMSQAEVNELNFCCVAHFNVWFVNQQWRINLV